MISISIPPVSQSVGYTEPLQLPRAEKRKEGHKKEIIKQVSLAANCLIRLDRYRGDHPKPAERRQHKRAKRMRT